ncbi:MAG: hypothetical protein JSW03_04035 [Candidatus Eiseniibacteriota bacterium]|nr:MAG: hypothetical protein JSW03_04035 [Candidatus Eisenbacteria bacterium]
MTPNAEPVSQSRAAMVPDVGWSFSNGWQVLWKYFLELLLISIVLFLFSLPTWLSEAAEHVHIGAAVLLWLFTVIYGVLLLAPIEYGVAFGFLKAARLDRLDVKDIFEVFQNWANAVLANILVAFIVGVGILLLIIPGIVFACKLAFVPYIIVDRKLDAIQAVKESWRMTNGHALTVFLVGLLAIPISLAGLLCFIVGIIPAVMWIRLAFASLYHAVSQSAGAPPAPVAS